MVVSCCNFWTLQTQTNLAITLRMKGFTQYIVNLLHTGLSALGFIFKRTIPKYWFHMLCQITKATYWKSNYIFCLVMAFLNTLDKRPSDRTLQIACCSINNFDRTDGKIFKHLNKLSAHLCCERKLRTWIHQCTVNLRGKNCFQLTLQFRWSVCSLSIPGNPSHIFIATVVGLLTNIPPPIIQQNLKSIFAKTLYQLW